MTGLSRVETGLVRVAGTMVKAMQVRPTHSYGRLLVAGMGFLVPALSAQHKGELLALVRDGRWRGHQQQPTCYLLDLCLRVDGQHGT